MKSIYAKLFIGFIVSIIFSFSVAGFFAVKQNRAEADKMAIDELNNSATHIADLIKLIDSSDIEKILSDYATTSEIHFELSSTSSFDSLNKEYGKVKGHFKVSKDQKNKLLKQVGESIHNYSSSYIQYAKSYKIKNETVIVCIQRDYTSVKTIFTSSYLISGMILFVIGSLVFLIVSDFIVKPISNLTKATNELIKGNYKVRVNYSGNDEIAKLNNAFNQMAISLNKQEERRQQFISDVSHEFQTPLTAISGFANILKTESLSDEQRKKYADIILTNSNRLSTLSKNMLQLTLLEGEDIKLEKSEYSLIKQLNRVIETQDYNALSKDIEIEFIKPRGDIMIYADESRMEQVWINLINNAIKYTKNRGVITVEIKKSVKEVEVLVQDTGIGMSKESLSHIFERFYRDDKSRAIEGNGLGLSIVQRIIHLHEFNLEVSSIEDVGSTFTCKMPYISKSIIANRLSKKD